MAGKIVLRVLVGCACVVLLGACSEDGKKYQTLKKQIQQHSGEVQTVKRGGNASEGTRGFLLSTEVASLEEREVVQRENFYREQMFALLGKFYGITAEHVGETFAQKAR